MTSRPGGDATRLTAPLAMVASCALFALMGAFVKAASERLPTADLVFYRCAVGAVLIAAWARARGISLRTRVPGMHLWRCLTGVGGLLLWFHALTGLPLATAMTLNATSSVWMAALVVLSRLWPGTAGHRVDPRLVAAIVAGFGGVALLLQPTLGQHQWGHGLWGLGSGLLAAFAYLQLATLGRAGEPEERVVFYFCLTGTAVAIVAMGLGGGPHALGSPRDVALVAAIGLLATVAQWLMTRAYATGAPLVNAALQYLGIAFSILLGVLWFDDVMSPIGLAGIALIVGAGVAATRWRALPPQLSG